MENASKALLLAASVILGVLLFSTFIYMKDEIGLFQSAKVDEQIIEQNREFNAKFEAYNKTFTYGVDVISVISLAYNNNKKYHDMYPDDESMAEPYYINIEVEIGSEALAKRKYYYFWDTVNKKMTIDSKVQNSLSSEIAVNGGTVMRLFSDEPFKYTDMQNSDFMEIIKTPNSNGPIQTKDTTKYSDNYDGYSYYCLEYSWITDFKRRAFRCTDVKYNTSTGRITEMSFQEQSLDSYDYDDEI